MFHVEHSGTNSDLPSGTKGKSMSRRVYPKKNVPRGTFFEGVNLAFGKSSPWGITG
jgi:hypothetical protein